MEPAMTRILQKASENPEYQAIANYLMSRRSFPEMQFNENPSSNLGSFVSRGLFGGMNVPERGIVKLNRFSQYEDPSNVAPTVAHEMTHAAEKQLIKQYYEIKKKPTKSELETQFLTNFQKLIGSSEPEIKNWLKTVSPQFVEKEGDYRAKSNEALAFGLENAAFKNPASERPAPAHIDPTIATTLMLLLDQAQRVQDQQPQSQGR